MIAMSTSRIFLIVLTALIGLSQVSEALAHHILGRPSYQLNEDSNTPPTLQGESEMGDYYITYMIYPAFPKPKEPGRISVYIKRLDSSKSFDGKVNFTAHRDDILSFSSGNIENLGTQRLDDSVYRQAFNFHAAGDFLVRAKFESNGEDYTLDIPLRVGAPKFIGPIGIFVGIFIAILLLVSIVQYRRSMTGKLRSQHQSDLQN
ncbi:MAG: hypothetical protein HN731_11830 [Rhodospirillaceae bacterium]|jgi:hypothetical protein|nr:hypothetical protein [Rhodospirillaceae bacterium]